MRTLLMLIGLAVVIYAGWWAYNTYVAPSTVTMVEDVAVVAVPTE